MRPHQPHSRAALKERTISSVANRLRVANTILPMEVCTVRKSQADTTEQQVGMVTKFGRQSVERKGIQLLLLGWRC
jgi:hypothetical protein